MRLSEHFALREFLVSQEASRRGIRNIPGVDQVQLGLSAEQVVDNLEFLCDEVLEDLRDEFGTTIITSGYRCMELNLSIGGSETSSHMYGLAADLEFPRATLANVYEHCIKKIEAGNWPHVDQCIFEFPPDGWIHIGVRRDVELARGECKVATLYEGRTMYRDQSEIDWRALAA